MESFKKVLDQLDPRIKKIEQYKKFKYSKKGKFVNLSED